VRALLPSLLSALAVAAPAGAQTGRDLYLEGCATCHGLDARGIDARGPSLRGVGAAAADFYLSTGRMPLAEPGEQPLRSEPEYSRAQIDALVRYIGSLGGPPVPRPASNGDVARGFRLFTENCAGCHQVVARGGAMTGAQVPALLESTPTQVAEAVRVGPWVMPSFDRTQLDDRELADIVAYVEYAKHPDNRGGWSIGNIGPIPEGLVAWLVAGTALLLVARSVGRALR
jgi:ubiquinol-cytochrome c reductase cytochrome c subunit